VLILPPYITINITILFTIKYYQTNFLAKVGCLILFVEEEVGLTNNSSTKQTKLAQQKTKTLQQTNLNLFNKKQTSSTKQTKLAQSKILLSHQLESTRIAL